jgi:hypothetical protein
MDSWGSAIIRSSHWPVHQLEFAAIRRNNDATGGPSSAVLPHCSRLRGDLDGPVGEIG